MSAYRYICEFRINGKWQRDGEAWPTLKDATEFGTDQIDGRDFQSFRIRRFPMSAGELVTPSVEALKKAVRRHQVEFKVKRGEVRMGKDLER